MLQFSFKVTDEYTKIQEYLCCCLVIVCDLSEDINLGCFFTRRYHVQIERVEVSHVQVH